MPIDEQHAERVRSDPGLQPERTSLAWARTTFAFFVASSVFLRWLPHYGARILLLVAIAVLIALAIFASQYRRYRRFSHGLARERLHADPVAVLAIASTTVVLGVLGLWLLALTP